MTRRPTPDVGPWFWPFSLRLVTSAQLSFRHQPRFSGNIPDPLNLSLRSPKENSKFLDQIKSQYSLYKNRFLISQDESTSTQDNLPRSNKNNLLIKIFVRRLILLWVMGEKSILLLN